MPISPNYKPTTPEYTSQFVQEQQPYDLMLRAAEQKQSQIDEVRDLAAETRGKLSIDADPRLRGSFAIAKQREKQYMDALEKDMQEFYETGNVRRAARKLTALSNRWQNDPYKQQIEKQSKRFREDLKTFRQKKEKGKSPIFKWRQNGDFVSGVTEEGLYEPLAGVVEGANNEEIRKMFEEKMDIEKTRTITKQGKKVNYRGKPEMFNHIGLNDQGRLTDKGIDTFNQWITDIGTDRLQDYMQRNGMVSPDASGEEFKKQARRLYEKTAREVADRYKDYDITAQLEGYVKEETPAFTPKGTFETGETYNYRLPGFESVIEANVVGRLDDVKGEDKRNQLVNDIRAQMAGEKEMSNGLKLVSSIQNDLTQKGIFDPDAQENFKLEPGNYNYIKLKDILDRASRGLSISDKEAKLAKDLIGPDAGLGRFQTVNEIQDELVYTQERAKSDKPNIASRLLDKIARVEARHYQQRIKESKPQSINNPQGVGIPLSEQGKIADLNFGRTEVIDASKGIQIGGDYIDKGDLKPRRIVSLPLVKHNGRWVDFTKEESVKEKVPPERLTNKLFIEAEGKIDPTNLEPESRLQMFAASNEDIAENQPINAQFDKKKDKILKSDKMLIYVNDPMKNQIMQSVESDLLKDMFKNYTISPSEQGIPSSDTPSENL